MRAHVSFVELGKRQLVFPERGIATAASFIQARQIERIAKAMRRAMSERISKLTRQLTLDRRVSVAECKPARAKAPPDRASGASATSKAQISSLPGMGDVEVW